MTVGFGMIGAGQMAHIHAVAIAEQPAGSARLVAVTSGTRAPALAAEFGAEAEPSIEALLDRQDIDAVVIATPHTAHLPNVLAAAAAGKHILLEKPMAPRRRRMPADDRRLRGRRRAPEPRQDLALARGGPRRPRPRRRGQGRRPDRAPRPSAVPRIPRTPAGRSIPARAAPGSTGAATAATSCAGTPAASPSSWSPDSRRDGPTCRT